MQFQFYRQLRNRAAAFLLSGLAAVSTHAHAGSLNFDNIPLYVGANTQPIVMLDVTKDHQLHYKAYNDYTDLNGNGVIDSFETTYWHANNYYGYFDPVKCYDYDTTGAVIPGGGFYPVGISPGNNKYCNTITSGGHGTWSGNFLNWVTMTRMDLVRKLLYGGKRSTDTATATVLERDLLPQDGHAWAKYYAGSDIASLTPYNPPIAAPGAAATGSNSTYSSNALTTVGSGTKYFRNIGISVCRGDQVKVSLNTAPSNYMVGVVSATDQPDCSTKSSATGGFTLQVDISGVVGAGSSNSNNAWTVTDLTDTGISFCNVTNGASSGPNSLSQTNTNPPLLRIAKGNFALWGNNDIFECQWNPGGGARATLNTNGGNGNIASLSGSVTNPAGSINWADSLDPIQSVYGMGYPTGAPTTFDLVVRMQACASVALVGSEKCKIYGTSLKPIGLLQTYGDPGVDQIYFGLMTGSYAKNKSGGVLRKNAGTFTDEINAGNGTFLKPATGSIVDTLDKLKLYGYQWAAPAGSGNYGADGCGVVTASSGTAALNRGFAAEGSCTSWGNPMSEVFLESLRYLAGKTANPAFTYSGSTQDSTLGLPLATWKDPLTPTTYCASLNALVFSADVSSFDDDQLGGMSDLNTAVSAQQWTNIVGDSQHENINGGTWFIGNSGAVNNNICSPKTLASFGSGYGICPEAPDNHGTYLMSGIAYEAHTNRIRASSDPVAANVPQNDTTSLKANTYGISLTPNIPKITIPVGSSTVTLLPAARMEDAYLPSHFGAGQIVDLKVISLTPTSGQYFVQWDVSEQGADYEMDIWGTISYVVNNATNQITVTTKVVQQSASGCNGFGYVISGTTQDGAHFHSGTQTNNGTSGGCANVGTPGPGFYYQYVPPSGPAITECSGCSSSNLPTSKIYTATGGGTILKDPLWYAAKYGGFHDLNGNGIPDQTIEWDGQNNTTGTTGSDGLPDNFFPVTNANQLESSLDRSLVLILGNSSASSVATNSTSLNTGTRVFQARFNSADWSGQLISIPVDLNGNISTTPDWDAGQQVDAQTPAGRVIISYNPALATPGIPFEWANVSANASFANYLNQNANGVADGKGSLRLAYLRGDSSQEGTSVNTFRRRPASKLGDIIDSNPQFVGAPSANYPDASYQDFVVQYASRTPLIYVGANDGMLHGFNALSSTGLGGGNELLGYVPSKLYSDFPKLTSQNYVHRYFVDGTPNIKDVCMTVTSPAAGACPLPFSNWKSVLAGTLRTGGKGVFALDVTDPSQFAEAKASQLAMWEFNDSDDSDLGFVNGQPQIGKMANGKWAVVFGNGYDNTYTCTSRPCPNMGGAEGPLDSNFSSTGHGVLYILFIQDGVGGGSKWSLGNSFIKLDTMVGTTATPDGLSQPVLVDANGDGVVDYVYVGDLQGNMWKFDVTDSNPSNWKTSFGTPAAPVPLFTAQDASNNVQPITSAPVVAPNPQGGRMVLFGTGLYLQLSDPSNLSQQTLYGIWDNGSPVNGRGQLVAQTVLANVTTSTGTFRVASQNTVNYGASPAPTGWFMDFPNVDGSGNPVYGSGTATGERVVFNPIISSSKITVTTLVPSVVLCTSGGTSYIMDLDPLSGGRLNFSPFDTNGDNNFNTGDLVTIAGIGSVYVSGVQSTVGIVPTPTVISGSSGSGKEFKVLSGSSGALASVLENPGPPPPAVGGLKRRAWREIMSH
ncbi:MAG TPA: PilC/PilY family type IV pilus protein [Burkholderiales bacterium]|nr:PilC/PilY family type IV pilus protein [Burkholderiales bacterium]